MKTPEPPLGACPTADRSRTMAQKSGRWVVGHAPAVTAFLLFSLGLHVVSVNWNFKQSAALIILCHRSSVSFHEVECFLERPTAYVYDCWVDYILFTQLLYSYYFVLHAIVFYFSSRFIYSCVLSSVFYTINEWMPNQIRHKRKKRSSAHGRKMASHAPSSGWVVSLFRRFLSYGKKVNENPKSHYITRISPYNLTWK